MKSKRTDIAFVGAMLLVGMIMLVDLAADVSKLTADNPDIIRIYVVEIMPESRNGDLGSQDDRLLRLQTKVPSVRRSISVELFHTLQYHPERSDRLIDSSGSA